MNALVTIETITPDVVFAPGGVEAIISKLEADVRSIKTDMSTAGGRKEIASLAHKVARSKTALDDMGKDLVSGLKAQAGKIDAERRVIRDRLDALKDEVRKPLTDWENADKERIAAHEAALATLALMTQIERSATATEIADLIKELDFYTSRDWQEFAARAAGTIDEVRARLNKMLAEAEKREAEAAELARLRAEQAAREQAEREARIAAEAAAKARAEAEAKAAREAEEAALSAERERNRAEQERAAAIAQAERAEAARRADALRAEQAAKEAADRAERDRAAAVEAERRRAAEAAAQEAAAAAKREANKAHKAKVNNAAVAALMAGGLTEDVAKLAITMIAMRQIPAVSISY